jgi:arylsulfatase A-like enzyme
MKRDLPNIILIVCDTLGAKHMSLYGYERRTTPNLERLVEKEGFAIYENCYSTSGWSNPAHASLFTGLYSSEHGLHIKNMLLPDKLMTLPEVLKEIGFYTVSISCNNFISKRNNFHKGFIRFIELEKWLMIFNEGSYNFKQLKKTLYNQQSAFKKLLSCIIWGFKGKNPLISLKFLINRVFHRLKARYDQRFGVAKNSTPYTLKAFRAAEEIISTSQRPLFLFINIMQTHHNYNPPRETRGVWSDPTSPYRKHKQNPSKHYARPFKKEVIDYFKDLYDEEVLYLDSVLVSFYNKIKAKLGNNFVFIITSDHGEHFGEDGRLGHILSLHDSVLWIPLLIRYPNSLIEGRQGRLVQINDLFATLSELIDSPFPHPKSSLSFLSSDKRREGRAEIVEPYLWHSMLTSVRQIEGEFLRIIK